MGLTAPVTVSNRDRPPYRNLHGYVIGYHRCNRGGYVFAGAGEYMAGRECSKSEEKGHPSSLMARLIPYMSNHGLHDLIVEDLVCPFELLGVLFLRLYVQLLGLLLGSADSRQQRPVAILTFLCSREALLIALKTNPS
ncbi:hypothetical protein VNO77_41575 [Canavalia gladiata]|uniref:Uncharacterized protein n=1 Tax=Canavalia gladiata TaxID=3824 RepID=A0AAN9PRP1_CANGL